MRYVELEVYYRHHSKKNMRTFVRDFSWCGKSLQFAVSSACSNTIEYGAFGDYGTLSDEVIVRFIEASKRDACSEDIIFTIRYSQSGTSEEQQRELIRHFLNAEITHGSDRIALSHGIVKEKLAHLLRRKGFTYIVKTPDYACSHRTPL